MRAACAAATLEHLFPCEDLGASPSCTAPAVQIFGVHAGFFKQTCATKPFWYPTLWSCQRSFTGLGIVASNFGMANTAMAEKPGLPRHNRPEIMDLLKEGLYEKISYNHKKNCSSVYSL